MIATFNSVSSSDTINIRNFRDEHIASFNWFYAVYVTRRVQFYRVLICVLRVNDRSFDALMARYTLIARIHPCCVFAASHVRNARSIRHDIEASISRILRCQNLRAWVKSCLGGFGG